MGGNEINPENYKHVLAVLNQVLHYLDTSPADRKGQSESGFRRVFNARPQDQFFYVQGKPLGWELGESLSGDIRKPFGFGIKQLKLQVRELIEVVGYGEDDYRLNYFSVLRRGAESAVLCNLMEKAYSVARLIGKKLQTDRYGFGK
ncbi:MAG: hypothetical protein M2R45_04353 [Verrucomicrobia subdivision 3 bacterium]|nr:hypothetical protein [Limisphaerales bacterium]MCS1416057.1 hypothetical protein [Limisphaerales bacterium]